MPGETCTANKGSSYNQSQVDQENEQTVLGVDSSKWQKNQNMMYITKKLEDTVSQIENAVNKVNDNIEK